MYFSDKTKELLQTLSAALCLIVYALAFQFGLDALIGAGSVGLAVSGMLAKVFSDPMLKQMWEQEALKEGENQTEFTELEIGTTFATDGAKPSETVTAAPILFYDKLQKQEGGRFVNIEVHEPLYTDIQDILKKWRYSEQPRRGSEQKAERATVRAVVDNIFLALEETEIKQGLQETANANPGRLMRHLVTLLGRNTQKRCDVGIYWALTAGYDMHHYVNIGLRKNLATGAVPVGEAKAGVYLPPTEHPNSYVWSGGVNNKVAFSATQGTHGDNINDAVGAIGASDTPSLAWIRSVWRTAWRENLIPAKADLSNVSGMSGQMDYYILYVPGRVRDLLEQDTAFMELYTSAYQGYVLSNPLLRDDDLMYKGLIIRSSKWLEDPYFSMANSFNAAASTDTFATAMSFNLQTIGATEWADIDPGTRSVPTGSQMETDSITMDQVARCFLLGANAAVRATGTAYALERREITDYGNKDGIGQDKYFGQNRIDTFDYEANYDQTIQSQCFIVNQGG